MRQGHDLRPGQTYYLLYLNNKGAVQRGDQVSIESNGRTLHHVPVR
jgi:hypothetical protein